MIDQLIVKAAEFLASHIKSTTLLKVTLLAVILSLPVGALLGQRFINFVLAAAIGVEVLMQFLYAYQAENPIDPESS